MRKKPTDKVVHEDMVGWYDLGQLSKSAAQAATSTLLGTRGDFRLVEALERKEDPVPFHGDQLFFDYVADTGDGWNPTYAVASLLARPELELGGTVLPRGQFLVMGGDEVYPMGTRDTYHNRFVGPYAAALPKTSTSPSTLFAIPGNHDWYDGLESFTRRFCQQRPIGGWKTRQTRSYFALSLPHRWWLLAVDIQLESDIDLPQIEYFRGVWIPA